MVTIVTPSQRILLQCHLAMIPWGGGAWSLSLRPPEYG